MAGSTGTKTRGWETNKKTGKFARPAGHKRIVDAILALNGDLDEVFPEWSKHLRKRKQPKSLVALLKSQGVPLLWSVAPQDLQVDSRALITRALEADSAQAADLAAVAADWCNQAVDRKPTAEFGLECLAWASALPELTERLSPELWATLLGVLLDVAKSDNASLADTNPWDSQLLLGELPIALGYFFPEISECVATLKRGCEFVSSSVTELLDGSGFSEARHLAILRKLLACWMRCAWMTENNSKKSQRLSKAARKELDWLVRHVLRLTRFDQTFAFQLPNQESSADLADLISAALRWTKDSEDRALAKLVLLNDDVANHRLPDDPGYHSEWSEVAVLQPEWNPKDPRLTVTYDNSRVRAELCCRGEIVFSGSWEPEVRVDGERLEVVSEWEVNCWFSDFDVDFLEIEAELTAGWRIQRQFIMARQDHFLWTADVLLGEQEASIDYQLVTSFVNGVRFDAEDESREGRIRGRRHLATVCSPALPEWRIESHLGDLRPDAAGMIFNCRRRGRTLYAPLFFDLHRRRMRQPITWRQLSVGENLELATADLAVGFRVQAGPEQWLCYRSLTDEGNRTLLGQNYSGEFVLGRILSDGDVEPLIEIDGGDEEDV